MQAWRWLAALVLVGAVSLGFKAYGKAEMGADKLTWKAFDKENIDKPFWQEMKTETIQTMKVQGQEVTQKQTQTFFVKWTPKKAEEGKDGSKVWTVNYKIEGVKMNIQIGGNTIDYDSTQKDAPDNPLTQFFKALVGSEFVFTIEQNAKDGIKVKKVDGLTGFVDKLAAANDQLKDLLKTILSEDALKAMSDPTFAAFPKEADFKAGKWDYDLLMNMGPIGTYKTKYTYTLDKKKNEVAVTGTMNYAPPKGTEEKGLPFVIKDGDLKSTNISGTVTLDPAKGRVEKSTMQMDLKGNLKIDIAGQVTDVTLDQKQTSVMTTMDDDKAWAPVKGK